MAIQLRDYQIDSLQKIYDSWVSGNKAPLLVLPTGAGKTFTFSCIVKSLTDAGKTVWVLVHRQNLAIQTSKSFRAMGIEHGIIGSGFSENLFHKAQVAKVGSVPNRFDRLPAPDFVIVDEAHHATAGTWKKILDQYPNTRVLGVTATPQRLDGNMLGANSGGFFDDLIIGPSMKELVGRKFLMKPNYFSPSFIEDVATRKNGSDFDPESAAKALDKPKILNDVVKRYKQICDNQPAIAFCCTVKHAEDVAAEFEAFGYKATALVGSMDFKEQQKTLGKLSTGELHVVTACEIISEGTDIPDVSAAILLRPTWSLTLYLQQVGRALRVAPDKRPKFIIDMVGNIARHGHPLQDRDWQIEGKRMTISKRQKETDNFQIKNCPHCLGTFEASEIIDDLCPNCGLPIGTVQRKINIVNGKLVEIVWDEVEQEMLKWQEKQNEIELKRQKKADYWKSIHSCKTKDDLFELAKEKGYKTGWVHGTWARLQKQRESKKSC